HHRHLHSFPTRRSSDLANCAASSEPLPVWSENGPEPSFSTPMRIRWSGISARAAPPPNSSSAAPARSKARNVRMVLTREKCRARSEEHTSELQSPYDLV